MDSSFASSSRASPPSGQLPNPGLPRSRTPYYYGLANRLTSGRPVTRRALLDFAHQFDRFDHVPRVTRDRLRAWFDEAGPDAVAWRPHIVQLCPGWFNSEEDDRAAGIARPGPPPRSGRSRLRVRRRPRQQPQPQQQQQQQRIRAEDVPMGLARRDGGASSSRPGGSVSRAGSLSVRGGEMRGRRMMSVGSDAHQQSGAAAGMSSSPPSEQLRRFNDCMDDGDDDDDDYSRYDNDDDDDEMMMMMSEEPDSSAFGEGRSTTTRGETPGGSSSVAAGKAVAAAAAAAARHPLPSAPQHALPSAVTRKYPALQGTTVESYLLARAGEAQYWVRWARVWAQNLALDHERDTAVASKLHKFVNRMRDVYEDATAAVWVAEMCVDGRVGGGGGRSG